MNSVSKDASPATKLDVIFSHICSNQITSRNSLPNNTVGITIDLFESYASFDPQFFGLTSKDEMLFYLNVLFESKFIEHIGHQSKQLQSNQGIVTFPNFGRITFKGLNHLYEIEHKGILSKNCFVAMIFDEKKEKRLTAIRDACLAFGFNAISVEEYNIDGNHTIDSKIISAIKSSRFCIADFTGLNQGAYLEAGYAMGREMKVIFICEEKDFKNNRKHFDVRHYPFLFYTDFADLTAKLVIELGAYVAP